MDENENERAKHLLRGDETSPKDRIKYKPWYNSYPFSRLYMIERLREIYEEKGEIPRTEDLPRLGLPSVYTYKTYFGSWRNALEMAGIPLPKKRFRYRKTYGEVELLLKLGDALDKLGRIPTKKELDELGIPQWKTYRTRLGNFFRIASSLRPDLLTPDVIMRNRNEEMKKDYLLKVLKERVEELGRLPKVEEIRELGIPSYDTYRKYFQSWPQALKLSLGEEKYKEYKEMYMKYLKEEKELKRRKKMFSSF